MLHFPLLCHVPLFFNHIARLFTEALFCAPTVAGAADGVSGPSGVSAALAQQISNGGFCFLVPGTCPASCQRFPAAFQTGLPILHPILHQPAVCFGVQITFPYMNSHYTECTAEPWIQFLSFPFRRLRPGYLISLQPSVLSAAVTHCT